MAVDNSALGGERERLRHPLSRPRVCASLSIYFLRCSISTFIPFFHTLSLSCYSHVNDIVTVALRLIRGKERMIRKLIIIRENEEN